MAPSCMRTAGGQASTHSRATPVCRDETWADWRNSSRSEFAIDHIITRTQRWKGTRDCCPGPHAQKCRMLPLPLPPPASTQ
eukprot:317901-Pyramimonas_sp.AAC.1